MSVPPTIAPTRDLVLAKLRALFPASEQDGVLAALDGYEGDAPAGRARVQLAILKLAGGRAEAIPALVETAVRDYRDVLAPAEYPGQLALGFAGFDALPEAERGRVVREDRERYLAWLAS